MDAEKHVRPGFADYAFLLDGLVQFYLEAKPLDDNIYKEEYERQVITYAYSKGDTWAVLCNFKGLQVFNAQWETPKPASARVLNLTWNEYAASGSPIFLLSRRALEEGTLEKHAQTFGGMRPRIPVEKGLYRHMHRWRERLVRHFFRMGQDISLEQADEAAERLISRLIFIRSSEDRHIEAHKLRAALHSWHQSGARFGLTEELANVFADYDRTFDSDLFRRHLVDDLLSQFAADTQVQSILGDMIAGLHAPPQSSADYDFSVIDADVLGRVYEQYLGHVAQVIRERVAEAQRQPSLDLQVETVGLESKSRRRKQRGIYYTPRWVVDYMVRQTVGRFIAQHTHDEILNVKILDPTCGSGSFLIRAFDALLEYHAGIKGKKVSELDQFERLPILTNNIYGIDLDRQAVDIARLNLLLRAVARRELLPSLEQNIQQGNSLIQGDEQLLRSHFGDAWEQEFPTNWERRFPGVMKKGGFDIVIGNPPYVKEYVNRRPFWEVGGSRLAKYYQGKADIWYIFASLAIDLLKPGGLHSFIATNNWITAAGASLFRQKVLSETRLAEFVDFGDYKVFEGVGIQTMIYFLEKTGTPHQGPVRYKRITGPDTGVPDIIRLLSNGTAHSESHVSFDAALEARQPSLTFTFLAPREAALLARIESAGRYRLKAEDVGTGIDVHQDFVTPKHLPRLRDGTIKPGDGIFVLSHGEKRFLGLSKKEQTLLKPYYTTQELGRYYADPNNRSWIIYTESATVAKINKYPRIKAHLDRFVAVITSDNKPYGLHRARDENFFLGETIVSLRKTDQPSFTYTDFPCYVSQTFFVIKPTDINLKYLVAVLNSTVCHFWLDKKGKKQGEALQVDKAPLLEIPVRRIDFSVPKELEMHDRLVALVDRMLKLHQRLSAKGDVADSAREQIDRDIEAADREIDDLVYDLYGLTKKERALIESEIRR